MKKIVFAAMMLFGIAGITQAQTPAKSTTQKKEAVKPASAVTTVTPAKKPVSSTKASTTSSTPKVSAANIGKHRKAQHKSAKKPAKKS